jgi:hypothetical protein
MVRITIICVTKDQNGVIQEVGLDNGSRVSVDSVIDLIDKNIHDFVTTTPDGHNTVRVYAPKLTYGRRYITTSPDGKLPNNLDYLRPCSY